MPRQLDVRQVSIAYRDAPVVRDVSFTAASGAITCVVPGAGAAPVAAPALAAAPAFAGAWIGN